MNENTKDILIRAGKTFWQAALAYLLADAAVLQQALTDWSTGKQARRGVTICGPQLPESAVP